MKNQNRGDSKSIDTCLAATLADRWTRQAVKHHKASPRYACWSRYLLGLGAPSELIEGAHRAAIHEIVAARHTLRLASSYANREVRLPGLDVLLTDSAPVQEAETIRVTLAVEALHLDCLIQGFAGRTAKLALERTQNPRVAGLLRYVSNSKVEQVELAWAVIAWALGTGGTEVASALKSKIYAFPRRIELPEWPGQLDPEQMAAHGLMDPLELRPHYRVLRHATVERALAMLEAHKPEAA